ncbi:hypothetical protein SS50377_24465 [Spironucleus salmonicida]|uniref:Uncharacterized protein n=1 Tax=Spironucleus salmonicida TaxID=348837 RepID=V6LMS3_9EUKA|nr:hypothetical protein SS50377_24465 [Spironucleus salmonicida]|eukprot:EST45987.1 Hypothetical protein SS50377_13969 [Spironucleus salmonicida]
MPLTPTPKNKRYNDMINSTVLYDNIFNSQASVDHSPPYTPIAKFMKRAHNELPLHQQVTNSVLNSKIVAEGKRQTMHPAISSPVKLRMQHNNNAVRERRNDETRAISAHLNQRVSEVKSQYSQKSPSMRHIVMGGYKGPVYKLPKQPIKTRYDLLANDYEQQKQIFKEQSRQKSLEKQVIGNLCSNYAMSQKESVMFIQAKGGIDKLLNKRVQSSNQNKNNGSTENQEYESWYRNNQQQDCGIQIQIIDNEQSISVGSVSDLLLIKVPAENLDEISIINDKDIEQCDDYNNNQSIV